MKIGYHKVDITPKSNVELCGYGFYLSRKSTGIHDPLYARAIYLRDFSDKEILLISCDLIGINREIVVSTRARIEKETKIIPNKIMVSTTHTHSGPASLYLEGLGKINKKYISFLQDKIVEVAVKAREKESEGEIGFAATQAEIGYNRVEKGNPYDNILTVMALKSRQHLVIVYNYACHCVSLGRENTFFSADWPFFTNEKVRKETGAECVFLQGFCGDINVKDPQQKSFEKAEFYGNIVGEKIVNIFNKIKYKKDPEITMNSKIIILPLDIPLKEKIKQLYNEMKSRANYETWNRFLSQWKKTTLSKINKNCRDFLSTEIQLVTFGNECAFFIVGGEIFNIFGLKIRKFSPYPYNFLVGYANDYIGYIPDEKDFEKTGYGSTVAPMFTEFFHFRKDVGDVLLNEIRMFFESK